MESTWTENQHQYLDNMKKEIKMEMNQINQKINDNPFETNRKFDKLFKHLGIE